MKRFVLGALLIVFGLIGTGLYILLVSEEGGRFCIKTADRYLPGNISVDSVQGSLVNRFVLEGVHYSDGSNVVSIDRLSFSWRPASLLKKELDIRSLEIKGTSIVFPFEEPDDSAESFSLPSFTLPFSIKLAHANIDSLTVKTAEDIPETEVSSIIVDNLSAEGNLIRIRNFEITSEQYRVAAHGEIETSEVFSIRLNVNYSISSKDFSTFSGKGLLDGSLDKLVYETHLIAPVTATSKGILYDLAGDLTWKGTLQSDQIILSHLQKEWPAVTFTGSDISGEGSLSTYSLQAKTTAAYDSFPDMSFSLNVKNGVIGKETVDRDGSPESSFDGLAYEAHFLTPFVGSVKGDVGILSGDLVWKGSIHADQVFLSHLHSDWPEVTLSSFQTSGQGSLSSYSFQVAANAAFDFYQDVALSININGDGSGMQITEARLKQKEAVLSGKGQLAWDDLLTWQANLTGTQINPAIYDQSWPGNLDLEVFTSGQVNNGKTIAAVNLIKLDGELRGFPMKAKGKIEVDGNDLAVDTLTVESSDSFLLASGKLGDFFGFDFTLESSNLANFWPDLSGSMEASGRISGSRQNPEFQFDFSGDTIALGETKISDVLASGTGVITSGGSIKSTFTATDISIDGMVIDAVAVDLKGALQDHVLEARVKAPNVSTLLQLDGEYSENKWSGLVSNFVLQTDLINDWQLKQPASIALSSDNADIGKLCLVGVQSSHVCVDGIYEKAGQWSAQAEISSLPVDMLLKMQTKFKNLGGTLSGNANMKGQGSGIIAGTLNLAADNLFVGLVLSEDNSRDIVWKKNAIHADLDGNTADFKINSILQDGSSFTAEAVLKNIEIFPFSTEKTEIQGHLNFDILDLQPLVAISYPDIEPYGTLKGDLNITGKLMQPDFFGHAQLEQGKMILPSLGITVKDVEMNFAGKDNRIRMKINATSGNGTLYADGEYALLLQDNLTSEIAIKGENFEVVNLPEARINISPDLKMKISKQRGDLQGDILLTEAYIIPENLGGTVTSTKDVIFVDDQARKGESTWPFYTNITLKAGENVRVNAYGLRGFVGGQLQIIDQPSRTAIGEGNLNVREGTFSIYGRHLKIVKGRLLYSGNPLDNPGIDVRAENVASGVTTGIQVSGFLQEPDISFYSIPSMEKDEIIQRLLMNTSLVGSDEDEGFLGSVTSDTGLDPIASAVQDVKESLRVDDVKLETGQKSDDLSLVIGTWLTPKLYISYGKNLLKESDSFNTRYVLGHGFSLETESGTTQSGFDLMYEIDK